MDTEMFVKELNEHLSYLYAFSKQINELDFAASLSGEFRGMQDAGWTTTATAHEVFEEITALLNSRAGQFSRTDLRVVLMLYCQLSEAGGVYEALKNLMGVVTSKPYLLWPFQHLVKIKNAPARIIGPNANATFRDLATRAKEIGLTRLSQLLEDVFHDDIRNGISHADYVIWEDGLRLRRRNGGGPLLISYADLGPVIAAGVEFFRLIREYTGSAITSYDPPKAIVGRFSANPPMEWSISYDSVTRSFGLSSSAAVPATTPEYERQAGINSKLGGKVLAAYSVGENTDAANLEAYISQRGFAPNSVEMTNAQLSALVEEVERLSLWDNRFGARAGYLLLASPWGFRWLSSPGDFDEILSKPWLAQ